jgi:hypothetical protein
MRGSSPKNSKTVLTVLIVAAVFLLGSIGGATAAVTINGKDIKKHSIPLKALSKDAVSALKGAKGPQGPAGPAGPAAAKYWAVVNDTGGLVRSSGGVTSTYVTNGGMNKQYQVRFPADITQCAYQVTTGDTDPIGSAFAVDAYVPAVARSSIDNNTIAISLWQRNTPNNNFNTLNMGQSTIFVTAFC